MIRPVLVPSRSTLGFRRWAAALLDQQLWCLGRDVAGKDNVLLNLGFCRYRATSGKSEATLYTTGTPEGNIIWLWAFGVAFTVPGEGSIFVRRYDFTPRLLNVDSFIGINEVDRLPTLRPAVSANDWQRLRRHSCGLCSWIAGYEHWIAENYGTAWRGECLRARSKPGIVEAQGMATAWDRAAKQCRSLNASAFKDRIGPWAGILNSLRQGCSICTAPLVQRPSTKVMK
jgi:hypothetical protein